jgi:hypothetical protein
MLPRTRASETRFRDWKLPVMSRFPLTDVKDGNSIVVNFGFPAITKLDPTVMRFGKDNKLKVG